MALDRDVLNRAAREAAADQAEAIYLSETAGIDRAVALRRWRGRLRAKPGATARMWRAAWRRSSADSACAAFQGPP